MNTHATFPHSSTETVLRSDTAPDADRVVMALTGDMKRIADRFGGGEGYVSSPIDHLRTALLKNLLEPELFAIVEAHGKLQRPDVWDAEDAGCELDAAVTEMLQGVWE